MEALPAVTDDAVSISSRTEILDQLGRHVDRHELVLVFVAKLDRLKLFNHAYGVEMGDRLITAVGQRMREIVGARQQVGTLRRGMFMVLVHPGLSTPEVHIEEAVEAMMRPVVLDGVEHSPDLKIGVSCADPGRADVDQLLIEASAAMRNAVASRSTVVVADHRVRTQANLHAVIERDIEAALAADQLSFAYQPIVTLHDQVVHGAEALLRWNHPELGELDPVVIMQRIEALGLSDRFTQWSMDRVAREWSSVVGPGSGLEGASVSINLCEEQLANPLCVPTMQKALTDHGLNPQSVILEVVESGPEAIGEAAAKSLRSLADAGCLIALDDFGTGFNALRYFLEFPIHAIKFDLSLISSMATSETARVIVRGVARIAEELGVVTVAEGVCTDADAAACLEVPLTLGQGWQYGHPVSLDEFVATALRSREGVAPADLDQALFESQA